MAYSAFIIAVLAVGVYAIPTKDAQPDFTEIIPASRQTEGEAQFIHSDADLHPQRAALYPDAHIHQQHSYQAADKGHFPTGDYWLTLGLPYGSPKTEDKAKAAGKWSIWTAGRSPGNQSYPDGLPYETPTEEGAAITLYATCEDCPGQGGLFGQKATWTSAINASTVVKQNAECCTEACVNATEAKCNAFSIVTCQFQSCCFYDLTLGQCTVSSHKGGYSPICGPPGR